MITPPLPFSLNDRDTVSEKKKKKYTHTHTHGLDLVNKKINAVSKTLAFTNEGNHEGREGDLAFSSMLYALPREQPLDALQFLSETHKVLAMLLVHLIDRSI